MDGLIVKRFYGNGNNNHHYLSALSPRDFSPLENLELFLLRNPCVVQIATCNGLFYFDDYNGQSVICNPTLGQLKVIPPSTLPRPPLGEEGQTFFAGGGGFGYDPIYDDYKVIRILWNTSRDEEIKEMLMESDQFRQVELYSLKNKSWKEIPYPNYAEISPGSVTCVKSSFYWTAQFEHKLGVISFNFETESFTPYNLPKAMACCNYMINLVDYVDCLGFTASQKTGHSKCFQLWVFKQEVWRRVFKIVLHDVRRIVGLKAPQGLLFLEGRSNGEGLCELLVYDWIRKKMNKKVGINDYPGEMQVFHYIQNHVSLSDAMPINGPHNDEAYWRSNKDDDDDDDDGDDDDDDDDDEDEDEDEEDYSQTRRPFVDTAETDTDDDWAIGADTDAEADAEAGDT